MAPQKEVETTVFVANGFAAPAHNGEGTPSGDNSAQLHTYTLAADGSSLTLRGTHTLSLDGAACPCELSLAGDVVYVCMEGEGVGALRCSDSGDPVPIGNPQPTQRPPHGRGPAHISLDHTARWCLAANYEAGEVMVLPIEKDGSVGAPVCSQPHSGVPAAHQGDEDHRQDAPHPHGVFIDPGNKFVHAVDLGTNAVHPYAFDEETGQLEPLASGPVHLHDGAGPRHLAFTPDGAQQTKQGRSLTISRRLPATTGRMAFVVNELDNTLSVADYEPTSGVLSIRQVRPWRLLSCLPSTLRPPRHTSTMVLRRAQQQRTRAGAAHSAAGVAGVEPLEAV